MDKSELDARFAQHDLNEQLWKAAEKGNVEEIKALLARGANVDAVDMLGASALMAAALKGHVAAMQCLLEHGADASYKDEEWHTPLMCAIHSGNIAAVRLLLEHGAEVNAFTAHGTTALELAGIFKFTQAVECLLEHGATIRPRTQPDADFNKNIETAPKSRQIPRKQPVAAGGSAVSRAILKWYLPGIITNLLPPLIWGAYYFFGIEKDGNALAFGLIYIVMGLLALDAVCGIAALAVFVYARVARKPVPASFDFFLGFVLGFFLAGTTLLIFEFTMRR